MKHTHGLEGQPPVLYDHAVVTVGEVCGYLPRACRKGAPDSMVNRRWTGRFEVFRGVGVREGHGAVAHRVPRAGRYSHLTDYCAAAQPTADQKI